MKRTILIAVWCAAAAFAQLPDPSLGGGNTGGGAGGGDITGVTAGEGLSGGGATGGVTLNNAAPLFSGTDSGPDDAYVIAPTGFPSSYATGQTVVLRATGFSNLGSATLDAGPGAKAIKLADGTTDPADGDISAEPVLLVYDASANGALGAWIIQQDAAGGTDEVPVTPSVLRGNNAGGAEASNVADYPVASQPEAEAGTATNRYMTPERTAQAIAALASGACATGTVAPTTGTEGTCYRDTVADQWYYFINDDDPRRVMIEGDGTESSYLDLPELAANGGNFFRLYGADSQTVDKCIIVQNGSGASTSGDVLSYSGSTAMTTDGETCEIWTIGAQSGGGTTVTPNSPYLTIGGTNYLPYGYTVTAPPAVGSWTALNGASGLADGGNGELRFTGGSANGTFYGFYTSIGAYTQLEVAMRCEGEKAGGGYARGGVGVIDNTTGPDNPGTKSVIGQVSFTHSVNEQYWSIPGTLNYETEVAGSEAMYFKVTYSGGSGTLSVKSPGESAYRLVRTFSHTATDFIWGYTGNGTSLDVMTCTLFSWNAS